MMDTIIELVQADITTIRVDAIVNAANTSLLGGGGVDGAIHRAGGKDILEQCIVIKDKQGGCPVGEAVITTAGKLPAQYVIHTVGPVWSRRSNTNAERLLANAYRNSLKVAVENGVKSIAFPNISTGTFGFPKNKAAKIAIRTAEEFLLTDFQLEMVLLVCFDSENFNIYQRLLTSELVLR